jgi:hypothetical protein
LKYIVKNPFVRILLTRDCNSGFYKVYIV